MPARIYALAKELDLDSKVLVDLVKKVGITGKGSALASLSDDEAQKVRDHLAQSTSSAAATPAAAAKPSAPVGAVRDSVVPVERKQIVVKSARKSALAGRKEQDSASDQFSESQTAGTQVTDTQVADTQVADAQVASEGGQSADSPGQIAASAQSTNQSADQLEAESSTPAPAASGQSTTDSAPVSAKRGSGLSAAMKSGTSKGIGMKGPAKKAAATSAAGGKSTGTSSQGSGSGVSSSGASATPASKSSMASRIASRMGARRSSEDANAPIRRDSAIGGGGKVRQLDRPAGRGGDKSAGDSPKPKRREPRINVKMTSLPEVSDAPTAKAAGNEPKAQKPDVKLSPDAIAGHRQGVRAPLEEIARQEENKKRGKRGGLAGFAGEKAKREIEEEEKKRKKGLAGMATSRAERTRGKSRGRVSLDQGGYDGGRNYRARRSQKRKGVNTAAPRKDAVVLELPCTIRSFSEAAGVSAGKVLGTLMQMGVTSGININSQLELETAELIAAELDLSIELKESETLEDALISELEEREDDTDSLVPRAPIVTFLGHVDHGKTSLLDRLVGIDVVSGEAGGITQHIRAYEVDKDGRKVTFVDTPGHEAFTEMRARGANVTDIAVLVIAADDGIMPQTEEAISHAKAADVPIVVALNKIDLDGVDENRVMTQLTEHQLTPSAWGGDVEIVKTSAMTGVGMDELLDTLLAIAELNEYTANPDREAMGVCLESEQQGDRGVVAKLIVQTGTLRVGDVVVCGDTYGRIRAMTSTLTGESIQEAGPSTPVSVMGFDQAPGAGDRFHVLDDISKAREIAQSREDAYSQESLSGITTKVSFENFQAMLEDGRLGQEEDRVKLNLIIRADVRGSLEAIQKELQKLDHPEVEIRVLQKSVGGVTLADVTLASASDAVIAAFNVIPDDQARSLAEERGVEIRRYNVIYKLTDEIKLLIEGRLKPEERVVELGRAVVKQTFNISRVGTVAGCYVAQGSIHRGCRIRINRDGRTVGDYALDSLKRIKEDVKEVPRGMECGIRLQGFNDIKQDDVLEAYKIEEIARTLD